jgi:hypothetical protein
MHAQKQLLFLLALAIPYLTNAGCERPRFSTSNGVYYLYQLYSTGQKKSFKRGDTVLFQVRSVCRSLTDSVRIYHNGTQVFSGYHYHAIETKILGKEGHYKVSTQWDHWDRMIWEFDFVEIMDTTESLSTISPAVNSIRAPDTVSKLLFDQVSQSFTVSGNDDLQAVKIHDLSGRVVYTLNTGAQSASLDFLPEGLYTVEIRTKSEKVLLMKLILN